MVLVQSMEEKLSSAEALHMQEMKNLQELKVKELQMAQKQLTQTQKDFTKEMKLEVNELQRAHAEELSMQKVCLSCSRQPDLSLAELNGV